MNLTESTCWSKGWARRGSTVPRYSGAASWPVATSHKNRRTHLASSNYKLEFNKQKNLTCTLSAMIFENNISDYLKRVKYLYFFLSRWFSFCDTKYFCCADVQSTEPLDYILVSLNSLNDTLRFWIEKTTFVLLRRITKGITTRQNTYNGNNISVR